MSNTAQQLETIDRSGEVRKHELVTPRDGPIDLGAVLKYHVQGVARTDRNGKATLAFSVSAKKTGLIWLAQFDLAADPSRPHRCPGLTPRGQVVATIKTSLPHPGGMQAAGQFLAVACEAERGFARIEIYDVANPAHPFLLHDLTLNGSLGEGAQTPSSAAGWLAFTQVAANQYLLFVGGKRFGLQEGWFYRYQPGEAAHWAFLGNFAGKPVSTHASAWGPQSGAAFVRTGAEPELVTFGAKGTKGRDALRARLRSFSLRTQPHQLVHEPASGPRIYTFPRAQFSNRLGPGMFEPNPRWGSSAFIDNDGSLLTYFTARNPRPDRDERHVLKFIEVRPP